jgi:hypothetical protein
LLVELERRSDRAGARAAYRKASLVVGDLEPGQCYLGLVPRADDRSRNPPAPTGDGIAGYLNVNSPNAVPDEPHATAPPPADPTLAVRATILALRAHVGISGHDRPEVRRPSASQAVTARRSSFATVVVRLGPVGGALQLLRVEASQ